jgi:hypothetical protein
MNFTRISKKSHLLYWARQGTKRTQGERVQQAELNLRSICKVCFMLISSNQNCRLAHLFIYCLMQVVLSTLHVCTVHAGHSQSKLCKQNLEAVHRLVHAGIEISVVHIQGRVK